MKKEMREILIELNEDDLKQVEAIAELEGRSRRAQISRIISEWLKRELAMAIAEEERQEKRKN